ncbi:DUF3558 domain-containing protein [Nocardia mangyaensis]|uniref:DUF3558 domain-containing protein n=1 Tax=Nocardia mangyaensis TaxID=2213200 RepID=UPI002675A93C|nr:DUF3558 domain-containing protein [Nocardia mangyaensis]MDO3650148.1 DUF3558 domain-containing protein [Nocardia mangyaensis]
MRFKPAVAIGLACVALAACSSSDSEGSGPLRSPPKVAALGPFVGECGHVSDDEVRSIAGLPQVSAVFRNAVGCNWQSAGVGSPVVTFASYRGSPIDRERAWVESKDRVVESVTVQGHSGFQSYGTSYSGTTCDFAVRLDDDFFEWSTFGFTAMGRGPCDAALQLAELTLERMQ